MPFTERYNCVVPTVNEVGVESLVEELSVQLLHVSDKLDNCARRKQSRTTRRLLTGGGVPDGAQHASTTSAH